jgi:TRAP-type C4-dicarboxylate transport system permease small subunit
VSDKNEITTIAPSVTDPSATPSEERDRSVFGKIKRVIRYIEYGLAAIGGVMFVAMMVLSTADVIGRYVFNRPIAGTLEITTTFMAGIVLLGWAYTQKNREHIRMELFVGRLPARGRAAFEIFTTLLSLVLFAAIVYQSTIIALKYWNVGRVFNTLPIPVAPFHFWVPIGGALLCLEFIIQMVEQAMIVKGGARNG